MLGYQQRPRPRSYALVTISHYTPTRRLMGGRQHPKERGLLSGCSVGAALALSAYPVVEAAFGREGLRLALLWGAVNSVAGGWGLRWRPSAYGHMQQKTVSSCIP